MLTYEAIPRATAMQESYIERILKARVYDVAIESPLEPARRLSRRLGNDVLSGGDGFDTLIHHNETAVKILVHP